MEQSAVFGGPVLAIGDWNAVEEEGALSKFIAAGRLIPLDDGDRSDLRPTNPTRTRRIDYGLSSTHIRATGVFHFERADLSDHLCVGYELDLEAMRECATLPRFPPLHQTDTRAIQACFAAAWNEATFDAFLSNANVDHALQYLYRVAETCLGSPETSTQPGASRADLWAPACRTTCARKATVDGHASLALHTLRKLVRQLRQLQVQPFDEHLRKACRRRCGDLRRRLPDFPFLDLSDLDRTITTVDALQQALAVQEKNIRVARKLLLVSSTRRPHTSTRPLSYAPRAESGWTGGLAAPVMARAQPSMKSCKLLSSRRKLQLLTPPSRGKNCSKPLNVWRANLLGPTDGAPKPFSSRQHGGLLSDAFGHTCCSMAMYRFCGSAPKLSWCPKSTLSIVPLPSPPSYGGQELESCANDCSRGSFLGALLTLWAVCQAGG